jgi:hypothetical protein
MRIISFQAPETRPERLYFFAWPAMRSSWQTPYTAPALSFCWFARELSKFSLSFTEFQTLTTLTPDSKPRIY